MKANNIGPERRVHEIEPVVIPVPGFLPEFFEPSPEPGPVIVPEPEKVPA